MLTPDHHSAQGHPQYGQDIHDSPSDSESDEAMSQTQDEEDSEDYCKGGYHPVSVGEYTS